MADPELLVLGLGNVLCSDDGAGPAVVGRLAARWQAPAGVRVTDGGTLGLTLLSLLADADHVLLVDAVRVPGLAPGTLVRLTGDDVAAATREQLSVHQVGVADLLDALRLLDRLPRQLSLLGVVPESIELGFGCTPAVEAALEDLVTAVVDEAASLGFPFRREVTDALPAVAPGGTAAHAALL